MAKFREIIVKAIDIESGNYINITDEIKSFQALDIYLVPKKGGQHDRYVVDNNRIISKQSGGKLLPLSEFDGVPDNLSPYVSVNIDKENGIRFNQYDGYYGTWYQTSNFNLTRDGFSMGCQMNDGSYQRSGGFNINSSGFLILSSNRTSTQNYQSDQTYFTLNSDTNSIKNTFYKGSLGQEKNIEFSFDGIKTNTLPNAEGDPTFTKQVVIKDDGTFGVMPKSTNEYTPTFYPKVDIIEYIQDDTNYYVRIAVSNMQDMTFGGNPYFQVSVGKGGNIITAVAIKGDYADSTGAPNYAYTNIPFIMGGFHFIVTIPKAENNHPWWNDDSRLISVTWTGRDALDNQGGVTSPYEPRRIANDTKKIGDIKPKGGIPYSGTTLQNPITGELNFGSGPTNARLIKGTDSVSSSVSLFNDARLTLSSYNNMDRTYIQMDKDKVSLWGNATGANRIDVKTFSTTIQSGTNQSLTVSSAGVAMVGLPNAQGDPTFTRQLVQKEDGSIGYESKPSEPINIDIHIIDRNPETGAVTIGVTVSNVRVPNSVWGQPPPEDFRWEPYSVAFIGNDGILSAITDIPLNNPSWGADYKKVSTQVGTNYCLHFSIRIAGGNVSYYDGFGSKAYRVTIRLGDKFVTTTVMYKPF